MNAYFRNAQSFAVAISGRPVTGAGYRALRDVIAIYQNDDDTRAREQAEKAVDEGRPAYWTSSNYSDAISCMLVVAANLVVEFETAIDSAIDKHRRPRIGEFLDRIIPLNAEAADELSNAYARHTATWRDAEELMMRRYRGCRRASA